MILTGASIQENVELGKIMIDPFDLQQVNPNSYNFRLGNKIKIYKDYILDAKQKNPVATIYIPKEGLLLQPGRLYLGHTKEVMGSTHYVPIIHGRSSIGRLGLFVHITSDLIDIGSINQWTLQLHAVHPIKIYAGMHIGQVTFWKPEGVVNLYKGKYQGSRGPVESHSYKEFKTLIPSYEDIF